MRQDAIRQTLFFDIEKLKSNMGYLNAGYPNYETLFGRDSLIAAWQLLFIYPAIAKDTLTVLARYQAGAANPAQDAEPGKILHEYRFSPEKQKELPNWEWPYYGSVDATSLFLILLEEYVKATNDLETLQRLWPAAVNAIKWHIDNGTISKYGFISYQRKTQHGLFHQGWKDSFENHLKIDPPVALVEEQGYAYRACKAFVALADRFPRDSEMNELVRKTGSLARRIKTNFSFNPWSAFWMVGENYPALALGRYGHQRMAVTSNPGHLLACGDFLSKGQAHLIVRRLFGKELWTIGGIRTLSLTDPDFDPFGYHLGSVWPHDNWMIYIGLRRWGFHKEANRIKTGLLRAYETLGCIPECYAVTKGFMGREKIVPIKRIVQLENHAKRAGKHLASFSANQIQAWASGALLNMLNDI